MAGFCSRAAFVVTSVSLSHGHVFSSFTNALTSRSPLLRRNRRVEVQSEPSANRRGNTLKMQGRGGSSPAPPGERVISILPYLIPLLDSLSFGRHVFSKVPLVAQLLLPPLLPLYSIYRGIPLVAFGIFLVLYLFVVRNTNISRYIRFNTFQALFLDIALIFPQLFQGLNLNIPATIAETCTTAVFYAAILAVIYSVVRNAQGQVPDEIPGVSDSVYQQMGPF